MIPSSLNSNIVIRHAESSNDRAACLAIRMEVFVDEQKVSPEEEFDGIDDQCLHFLALEDGVPFGTARIIPKANVAKIGRVAITKSMRGKNLGLALMQYVVDTAITLGFTEAVLDAQTYAIPFYARLGFVQEGDEFLDANIPHYRMRRQLP